jgi:futalosine hydrolase
MDLLVVAATKLEIAPFLATNHDADVLLTGVGIPSTIFHLTAKLSGSNYDLVIQAGIAGTFNGTFEPTEVMVVEADTFADVGVDEKGRFQTLFEAKLSDENEFPFEHGWLKNKSEVLKRITLPFTKGVTVNKITDDENELRQLNKKFRANLETMEGAAFHYVCLQRKVNFLQLRSISNTVGERDKNRWKLQEAIASLNIALQKLIAN